MINLKCYVAMKKTSKPPHNNWGKMPRAMLRHVKGNDLTVFADLLTYADTEGQCFPSVQTISNDTGINVRNIKKHLKKLEEDGWIKRTFRTNNSTLYQLYFADTSTKPKKVTAGKVLSNGVSITDMSGVVKSDTSVVSISATSGVSKSDTLTDQLTDQNNRPQEQLVAVSVVNGEGDKNHNLTDDQQNRFENLWSKYSQEGEAKGSALSAWRKYCSMQDEKLLNIMENSSQYGNGTYLTTTMKSIHQQYKARKAEKEKEEKLRAEGNWCEL